jgi:hypothetical protein
MNNGQVQDGEETQEEERGEKGNALRECLET